MIAKTFTPARLRELWRYYQAGVVNTVFGIGLYSALVWLGVGKYESQLASHVIGMVFNYFTYSRHVFKGVAPAKMRFVISYGVNYIFSLAMLYVVSKGISNPYLAGIISAFIVSVVNYVVLKVLVFKAHQA